MLFKKKYYSVVVFSSVIIAVVLISTIIGYSLYLQWKKDSVALRYTNTIYRITAEILKKDINVSNINARIADAGVFKGMPLLEGTVENKTTKTIDSFLIEVSFLSSDGSVIYKDRVFPLGEEDPRQLNLRDTSNVFSPRGTMSFTHLLRNCPQEVIDFLQKKGNFARSVPGEGIRMEWKIVGVSFL